MDTKIENLKTVKCIEKNVFYNVKVLIERLPEHVVKALLNKKNVNAESISSANTSTAKTNRNRTASFCIRFCKKCRKPVNCNLQPATCPKCKNALSYQCKKCKKHLMSYFGFFCHIRTTCQSQGHYYQCPGCPHKSALKVRIKRHIQKLHKNVSVSDIILIANEDSQKDIETSELYVHKCLKCGQQFKYLYHLNHHLKTCGDFKYRVDITGKNENENKNEDSNSKDQPNQPTPTPDALSVMKLAILYCKKCDKKMATSSSVYGPQKCKDCKSNLLFECKKCNKQYKSAKGIVYHFKAKCDVQEIYFCSKCDYQNPYKKFLTDHYRRVHEIHSVECPKCKSIMKNKGSLSKHLEYCGKEAYLKCDMCSFKTNNRTALRSHRKRHDSNIQASCPKCKKKLKNHLVLRDHLRYCGLEPSFRCTQCAYKSLYKKNLREHVIRKHFKDENKCSACPKCGAKFESKSCEKAHLRFCGKSEPHLQCDYCPFKSRHKMHLRSHITRLHLSNINRNSDNSDVSVDVVN